MKLLTKARPNKEVLKDVKISGESKKKIRKVELYKKYFFEYFQKPSGKIYSSTTFLDTNEVSFLVIVSSPLQVKALEEYFPIVGSFPYLGFFHKKSAKKYAKRKEDDGNVTWIRPVYAYSTLNYFTDPILSSFFHYSDYKLAELIFHELLHTVLFINGEVDLSEALAQYFGRKMAIEYFKFEGEAKRKKLRENRAKMEIQKLLVSLVADLNGIYKLKNVKKRADAEAVLDDFLKKRFYPSIERKCSEYGISGKKCFPLKRRWNNASLAAWLTYEGKVEKLANLHKKLGVGMNGFLYHLEKKYDDFKKQDVSGTFENFLFQTAIAGTK
ncbi:MAG: aminopeptidase [Bacteriovoracaceae bacterium]|nr:aminopeptidase [Bacteriovoracaceae bacterium]